MSDPAKRKPRATRAPAQRAHGLDPEVTAQPRPIADELALETSAEPELSMDPEDLGSRFLSDAIEQGDFDPERASPGEASLFDNPARDQPFGGTNFVAGNPIWEQTVDLETRTQGAADQLREPQPPLVGDAFDEAFEEASGDATEARTDHALRVAESGVREFSLLDREGEEGDDTVAPDVDLDEQGSHTRMASRQELGQRVESREPSHLRRHAARSQPGTRESAARTPTQAGEKPAPLHASLLRLVRSVLTHAAWTVRRLARRHAPRATTR